MSDITRLLADARGGDAEALRRVTDRLYVELGQLARREMRGERPDHTLEPTALVHELYLRLLAEDAPTFENRAHFFASAAVAIRRLLIEHARARARHKRGGGRERVTLDGLATPAAAAADDEQLLAVHEALERLAQFDPQKARLVELRFFAGCSVEEVAQVLGVSESTVAREWRLARAWLQAQLGELPPDEP
jgi:RNA polymerase sigma factor (TIGR02999 family)